MAYQLTTGNYNYFTTLLARMADAHENSGAALRKDLKATLDETKAAFHANVNSYIGLRAREKEVRGEAAQLQASGREILRKAKHALRSQLPKEQVDSVLQAYQLHLRIPAARVEVLGRLRLANEAVAQQTEENRKPPKHMQTSLKEIHDALAEKVEAINGIKADIEEAKRALRQSMRAAADLRDRVYSYLVGELSGGTSDPRLIDYGIRSRFAERRRVTVVNEEEPVTEEVEE